MTKSINSLGFVLQEYGSNFNHRECDVIGPKTIEFREVTQNDGIMPLKDKIINFSNNGKPVCDFLCVNNNNLPPYGALQFSR